MLRKSEIQINPVATTAEACDFCNETAAISTPHFSRLTKHGPMTGLEPVNMAYRRLKYGMNSEAANRRSQRVSHSSTCRNAGGLNFRVRDGYGCSPPLWPPQRRPAESNRGEDHRRSFLLEYRSVARIYFPFRPGVRSPRPTRGWELDTYHNPQRTDGRPGFPDGLAVIVIDHRRRIHERTSTADRLRKSKVVARRQFSQECSGRSWWQTVVKSPSE